MNENGFTKIDNEILEKLGSIRLPGEVNQIVNIVFRQTYGWNKREDWITLSQFSKFSGIKRTNITRSINKAINLNIIKKRNEGNNVMFSINENLNEWIPIAKRNTKPVIKKDVNDINNDASDIKKDVSDIKKDNKVTSKKMHTKDIITKDTYNNIYIVELENAQKENEKLKAENKKQEAYIEKLKAEIEKLKAKIEKLKNGSSSHAHKEESAQEEKDKFKYKIFIKPTVTEISDYCRERSNNIDAEYFYDYYESKGWMIGKGKMKDWKASIRTWEKNQINKPQQEKRGFVQ